DMRRSAGECGYRSMLVAIGAAEGAESNCEVISYEAPFGVGYMVAQLAGSAGSLPAEPAKRARGSSPTVREGVAASENDTGPPATAGGSDPVPTLARLTIETFVKTGKV